MHPLVKNTDESIQKMTEQLEEIHTAFCDHVSENRNVDMGDVFTGEAWLAKYALEKGTCRFWCKFASFHMHWFGRMS